MSEYPSDQGHWERINESASAINYGRELNMHTVVEDVCRALLDLNEAIHTAKADTWTPPASHAQSTQGDDMTDIEKLEHALRIAQEALENIEFCHVYEDEET